jgi:hypothetical protein
LHQLRVAFVLARVGLLEGLLGSGEVGGKLRAVATVGAPGADDGDRERRSDEQLGETEPESCGHSFV